ncbi:single-stranded DNA-binding protein WHY2, mitochondrial [Malania oleifera]|uniref:single-stranded DNA-binding protein WHY2, mitochondrial n=1 Tax=Malania oleifera TaxID=397392 RepID=UPI0025ADDDBD|nr:single-stranded DNA-binding protein WHY2, mitochondrial [Malania oleifera]
MMKVSRFLQSRTQMSKQLVFGRTYEIHDALRVHGFASQTGISTAGENFPLNVNYSDRIFAPYSIYKGKAALSAIPVLPTFAKLDSGSGLKVDRRGVMMLKFWPAVGERKYDWERRQMFALSPTEVGSLLSLGPHDSCEFFHDPAMKTSNAGQVRKSLSVKPYPDGTGYFMSLTVANNIQKTNDRLTVPVTTAEFAVMRAAFSYALPRLMGWDYYGTKPPSSSVGKPSKVDPQHLDLEWDR